MGVRAFSAEIPVGAVGRVMRTHVATAIKADAILDSVQAGLKEQPSFLKTVRTVCKGEWAYYEATVVFGSADTFGAYMEGDWALAGDGRHPGACQDGGAIHGSGSHMQWQSRQRRALNATALCKTRARSSTMCSLL